MGWINHRSTASLILVRVKLTSERTRLDRIRCCTDSNQIPMLRHVAQPLYAVGFEGDVGGEAAGDGAVVDGLGGVPTMRDGLAHMEMMADWYDARKKAINEGTFGRFMESVLEFQGGESN